MSTERVSRVCGEPKIFVGQIPSETTKEQIIKVFGEYGKIRSASMMTHPDGRSRGCAMVLYEKWAQAEEAMFACDGKTLLGSDRALVVNLADPPKRGGGVPPIAPKTLFVGQIPKSTDDADIRAIFAPYGHIVEFHVSRKGAVSGCAFVKYDKWAEAEMAMETLHGRHTMPGAKNPLVVKFADSKIKEENDALVGAKRPPINEEPWNATPKRPFQNQALSSGFGFGAIGAWQQTGLMNLYGFQNIHPNSRNMGYGGMIEPMASHGSYGMGASPPYMSTFGTTATAGMMIGSPPGIVAMNGMINSTHMRSPSQIPTGRMGPGILDPRANDWKLFVGQLPFDVTERDLWPLFREIGDILELVILRSENRSRGCAFVTYADMESAERAIKKFDGQVPPMNEIRGKKLVVRYADKKREKALTTTNAAAAATTTVAAVDMATATTEVWSPRRQHQQHGHQHYHQQHYHHHHHHQHYPNITYNHNHHQMGGRDGYSDTNNNLNEIGNNCQLENVMMSSTTSTSTTMMGTTTMTSSNTNSDVGGGMCNSMGMTEHTSVIQMNRE